MVNMIFYIYIFYTNRYSECGVDGVPISDELHDLLSGLLDPNPETRLNWKDLEKHPFFATTDNSVQSFLRKSQQTVAVDGILKQTVAVDETLKDGFNFMSCLSIFNILVNTNQE